MESTNIFEYYKFSKAVSKAPSQSNGTYFDMSNV